MLFFITSSACMVVSNVTFWRRKNRLSKGDVATIAVNAWKLEDKPCAGGYAAVAATAILITHMYLVATTAITVFTPVLFVASVAVTIAVAIVTAIATCYSDKPGLYWFSSVIFYILETKSFISFYR